MSSSKTVQEFLSMVATFTIDQGFPRVVFSITLTLTSDFWDTVLRKYYLKKNNNNQPQTSTYKLC